MDLKKGRTRERRRERGRREISAVTLRGAKSLSFRYVAALCGGRDSDGTVNVWREEPESNVEASFPGQTSSGQG